MTVTRKQALIIIQEVIEAHGITQHEFYSKTKLRKFVKARHEAVARLIDELQLSSPRVAEYIGYRDHTSVLHALKVMEGKPNEYKSKRSNTRPVIPGKAQDPDQSPHNIWCSSPLPSRAFAPYPLRNAGGGFSDDPSGGRWLDQRYQTSRPDQPTQLGELLEFSEKRCARLMLELDEVRRELAKERWLGRSNGNNHFIQKRKTDGRQAMITETAAGWWACLTSNRAEILAIAERPNMYGRLDGDPPYKWAGPGDAAPIEQIQSLAAAFNECIWKEDARFAVWFCNTIWAMAPDNEEIHNWPGWPALCDLCSESYLATQKPGIAKFFTPPEEHDDELRPGHADPLAEHKPECLPDEEDSP